MTKLLKRDVMRAHDDWANNMNHYGENNLATVRSAIRYRELRDRWERENGRDLFAKPARRMARYQVGES